MASAARKRQANHDGNDAMDMGSLLDVLEDSMSEEEHQEEAPRMRRKPTNNELVDRILASEDQHAEMKRLFAKFDVGHDDKREVRHLVKASRLQPPSLDMLPSAWEVMGGGTIVTTICKADACDIAVTLKIIAYFLEKCVTPKRALQWTSYRGYLRNTIKIDDRMYDVSTYDTALAERVFETLYSMDNFEACIRFVILDHVRTAIYAHWVKVRTTIVASGRVSSRASSRASSHADDD